MTDDEREAELRRGYKNEAVRFLLRRLDEARVEIAQLENMLSDTEMDLTRVSGLLKEAHTKFIDAKTEQARLQSAVHELEETVGEREETIILKNAEIARLKAPPSTSAMEAAAAAIWYGDPSLANANTVRVAHLIEQREAAARAQAIKECARIADYGYLIPPDGGSPTEGERLMCEYITRRIRALAVRAI
jgi:hypothetical protein